MGLLIVALTGLTSPRWEFSREALSMFFLHGTPFFLFAWWVTSSWGLRFAPFRRIFRVLNDSFLGNLLRERPVWQLLLLAISAGVGEEVLFRGAVQPFLGVWATGIVFGLVHAVTLTYFLVACAVGVYLGALLEVAGGNLFVPVLIHTVYDFLAFLFYRNRMRKGADPFPAQGGEAGIRGQPPNPF